MEAANYGYDYGFNGGWFWIVILLLCGNGNFGNNRNFDDEFIKRDIFSTNQSVMENRYASQLGDCGITKEVLENRYDNEKQTNILQAQMFQGFCDTKALILEKTNEIVNMYKDDKINALREQLFTATQAYNNQTLANQIVSQLQPVAKPAYLVSSPYATTYFPNCNCPNA